MKDFTIRTVMVAVLMVGWLGCAASRTTEKSSAATPGPLSYVVDLNDRSGDTFKVTLHVEDLGPENAVYQFASTAPGTYQVMDIGRFVRSFEAIDAAGGEIPSEQIATNQWRISDPQAVVEIRYELAETWDTPVDENPIYRMCGTSIEDDHVQINGQAVFGYPTGMQARPLRVRVDRPASWTIGTALTTDDEGWYLAENYDHIVDSPILAGRLTAASLDLQGTSVEIYTYSKTGAVTSEEILDSVDRILDASGRFLGELPVDRYAFLFHFEDVTTGAWEHSYSSTYTFAEETFDQLITSAIPSIVAHEFLHIVTPLNIHSDVIEQFNFVEPTPSQHVWLYEGTTEWMAHASQFRGGLIDLNEYLNRLSGKLKANDRFDANFSLTDIGLRSYSPKGQQEWGNIYQRGALASALLDIQLLSLSAGKRGLREVILDLSKKYGPDTAFDEDAFFDEFAEMTNPEIRSFFDDYVRSAKPLPLDSTFRLIGIEYTPALNTGEKVASFGMNFGVAGDRLAVAGAGDIAAECGLEVGDLLMAYNGEDVTLATAQSVLGAFQAVGADVPFTLTVRRDEDELTFTCTKKLIDEIEHHVLRVDPDASPRQVALREAWSSRL